MTNCTTERMSDFDLICDGHGYDTIKVVDEPYDSGIYDTVDRIDDGVPNEPTNKDPWDVIVYSAGCN